MWPVLEKPSFAEMFVALGLADVPAAFDGATAWLRANWTDAPILLVWTGLALALAVLLYVALSAARDRLVRVLEREKGTTTTWRSILATVIANTWRVSFVVLAVALGAWVLGVSSQWLRAIVGATVVVQLGLWLGSFLRESVARYAEKRSSDRGTLANAMSLVRVFINITVWSVVALVLLSNAGIDVTALVAGLGIGGIAIGLAAQGIFSDLFASLSIILDRPFVRGDFIVFGDHMGTIERIGIKSTRIRALSGEQIVIANANLLQSTIRNYKLLYERRVQFTVGIVYGTPVADVAAIPGIIRGIVESAGRTRFDRSHLKSSASRR
jgi:small-conductance mechanosensitive channel